MDIRTPSFVTREDIVNTPKSTWYKFTLYCGHEVYTKTRLSFARPSNEHYVRCPQRHVPALPTAWVPLEKVEAVTDDEVRNVHDGASFILPKRILRTSGDGGPTGNPLPYAHADSDY